MLGLGIAVECDTVDSGSDFIFLCGIKVLQSEQFGRHQTLWVLLGVVPTRVLSRRFDGCTAAGHQARTGVHANVRSNSSQVSNDQAGLRILRPQSHAYLRKPLPSQAEEVWRADIGIGRRAGCVAGFASKRASSPTAFISESVGRSSRRSRTSAVAYLPQHVPF